MLARLPKFYGDVLTDWCSFAKLDINSGNDVRSQCLWFNENVTIEKRQIFWKTWYQKGLLYVQDLLTRDGHFMCQNSLFEKYGIQTNFLELLKIRHALPYKWRKLLQSETENSKYERIIKVNLDTHNTALFQYLKSKDIYWSMFKTINKNIKPKCMAKWGELFDFEGENWDNIFSTPFKACKETALQSFQYKIVHRIIACNHWLYNLKIKNSPNCTKCNKDDTICHFFIFCDGLEQFWESFMTWWKNITDCTLILNEFMVLFGTNILTEESKMFNYCLIVAKKYIYDQKKAERGVDFYNYLVHLKNKITVSQEHYIALGKLEDYEKKWGLLLNNL